MLLSPESAHAAVARQPFDQIIALLQDLYAPDFRHQAHRLRILGDWETERVEASARREEDSGGQIAVITITGGLARHPRITEGQSDYFAASSCMRRFLAQLPQERRPGDQGAPNLVVQRCARAYVRQDEREICIQTSMSGYALSSFFADRKRSGVPRFETPDPNRVNVIGFGTPSVQCRLDTFSAAALCNDAVENAVHGARPWLCARNGPLASAARPACWYPETKGM